jgi:hypothetical protein
MTVKKILVTNGWTGWTSQTRATSPEGYRRAAERIWPHPGKFKGWVEVTDAKTDEVLFEEHMTFAKGETV